MNGLFEYYSIYSFSIYQFLHHFKKVEYCISTSTELNDPLENGEIFYHSLSESEKENIEELFNAAGIHLKVRNMVLSKILSIYGPHHYTIGILSSIVDIMGPQKE